MARGRSKTKGSRVSQLTYADLTEAPDYKLQLRVSELVESVKKAFKEKRRRDCTAIANAILELDPQNEDARFILSWIECDLERDLQLARALLPDLKTDESLYRDVQLIVQTVLDIDPGNKAAEALKLEIDSTIELSNSPTHEPDILADPLVDPIVQAIPIVDAALDTRHITLDPVRVESTSDFVDELEIHTDSEIQSLPESLPASGTPWLPAPETPSLSAPQTPTLSAPQTRSMAQTPSPPIPETPSEVEDLHQTQEDEGFEPQPQSSAVTEPLPVIHAVPDAKPEAAVVPESQPQQDAAPKTPPPVAAPPEVQPHIESGAKNGSPQDQVRTPADIQFQFPRRAQTQIHPRADDTYPIPERRFWKRKYVLLGLFVIVGVLALVQYTGMSDWLTTGRSASVIRPDTSDAPINSSGLGTSETSTLGDLEITIDDGIEIYINDQYAGKAPIAPIRSKPGVYEIRYKLDQTDLGSEKLTIAPGQVTRNSVRALLGSLEIFVLPSSTTIMQIDDNPAGPVQSHVALKPGKHRLTFTSAGYQPETVFASVIQGRSSNVTVILQPAIIGSAPSVTSTNPPSVQPPASSGPGTRNNAPAVAAGKGTLAVSSLLPVDIYLDSNHLGTTPVTLELPAGTYTFEYRYGTLRKTGVNVIKSNELTRATVVFEVTLQINSTPQAEVSLAGNQGKALGQTPLTSVRVPIGSTLVFRTAGHPEKSYTVTEKDTTISMVFP